MRPWGKRQTRLKSTLLRSADDLPSPPRPRSLHFYVMTATAQGKQGVSMAERQHQGFSLIEVIVAIGVISILMMGFMQLTISGQDDVASLQSKMGQLILAQDIRFKTSQSNLCMGALKSTHYNGGAAPMDFEFDLGGSRLVKGGADLNPTDNLVVKSFQLMNPTVVANVTRLPRSSITATGGTVVSGNLELVSAGGRGLKKEFKRMNVGRINLLVDSTSTIIDCNGVDLADSSNGSGSGNNDAPASECVAYAASMNGGTPPPWSEKWSNLRDTACDSLTFPMTKAQTVYVCTKVTGWGAKRTVELIPCRPGGPFTGGGPSLTSAHYNIGPIPPYNSIEDCKKMQITDGLQVASVDGDSGTNDFCIAGKMIRTGWSAPSPPTGGGSSSSADGT